LTTRNIFLAGVGGQGVILAGEILCLGLMERGFDVKKSEVHGMAQRGGSVTSHVRYGARVFSPIIPQGEADILLAFEALEGLRWLGFLKEGGLVVVNRQEIKPTTVTSGRMKYPENIYDLIRKTNPNTRVIDALEIARRAGNDRALNSVLVGAVSREMDVPEDIWKRVIAARFPKKLVPVNMKAFELGREAC
jgi:indolepyruvate ferredoxin oxidoreductase, beta subunit